MPTTINEIMTKTIKKAFVPANAAGVNTVMQFDFTGPQASHWIVTVKDQTLETSQGTHPDPAMTMTVDSDDYVKIVNGELDSSMAFKIVNGELDSSMAFMKGKVKVSGDMVVALGMGKYLSFEK